MARVRPGDYVWQLGNVSVEEGVNCFRKIQYKIGVKTQIVIRQQPDSFTKPSVFLPFRFYNLNSNDA